MFFNLRLAFFIYIFVFFALLTHAQQTVPLKFQGSVSDDKSDLSGVSVQIAFATGKVMATVVTDAEGNYRFEVPLEGDFLITVAKEGYVSKKFAVNTKGVPPEKAVNNFPIIEASLTLFKKLEGIDYSLLNKPLNKYSYNAAKDNFEYDKNHIEPEQ